MSLMVLGECVVSPVPSCCSKKFQVMDGLMLQFSFIWQAKENTSLRHEGRPTQKMRREEKPPAQFCLLFLYVFFPSP